MIPHRNAENSCQQNLIHQGCKRHHEQPAIRSLSCYRSKVHWTPPIFRLTFAMFDPHSSGAIAVDSRDLTEGRCEYIRSGAQLLSNHLSNHSEVVLFTAEYSYPFAPPSD